ncbi:MAG: type II secretion system F family protein [Lachnospiraceae bacterium]|nr:type II secretion system F family protein [Lachnospiraceae bacterium]
MTNYNYSAVDRTGKEIRGQLQAENEIEAREKIKGGGLLVLEVSEADALDKNIEFSIGTRKPGARDFSVFCRQFVAMTQAGVTIIDALKMLADQTQNAILRKTVKNTQISVEKGETLSDSMRLDSKVYPELLINMVEAGEATGALDIAFERMAIHYEKEAKLKALMRKAMVYPIVVGIVAVGVIILMLTFVIPRYVVMFNDLGAKLPGITVAVVKLSDFIIKFWYLIILVVIAIVIALKLYGKTESGRRVFGRLALKAPVFGNLTIKTCCARFARTMSTMLAAGISVDEAVGITAGTVGNAIIEDAIKECRNEIMQGVPLSRPLEESGEFPPMVYQMTRIGEESGDMEGLLTKLAEYYEEEVEIATQTLMAAMEPAIIIILAGIVGFLIMAIMAPMMSMYESLDNL